VRPNNLDVYKLLEKSSNRPDIYTAQLAAGGSPPKTKKKYTDLNRRLYKILSENNIRNCIAYWKGIAHNISLK